MAKRVTKQVKTMVEAVNERMKRHHIKNQYDPVFSTMQWLLIKADCYYGFNYFTVDGRLSGGDNEKFDHLQFYII